jgi:inhibitor of KinA sporulation pathway (predicted exonuclease)
MEIIEIGAVRLESSSGPIRDAFCAFVRPVLLPTLSDFCTRLTSIRQEDVDSAETFADVLPQFLDWIGTEPYFFCSWGSYDLKQFRIDCDRHKIAFPAGFENHINLKQIFAQQRRLRPMGMAHAMAYVGYTLEGRHHRGIDDARNIARLAQLILPDHEKTLTEP